MANKDKLVLVRAISLGSGAFTKALMTEMNLPLQQAEEYKRTYGLNPSQLEGKINKVLSPILETLINELTQSFTYFKEKHPEEVISRIVLAGGGGMLPFLPQYLQERLQIETTIGNPWQRVPVTSGVNQQYGSMAPVFGVATGLAVRDFITV